VGQTARRGMLKCKELGANDLYYDSIGVGAGVKSEVNRMKEENIPIVPTHPWNGGRSGKGLFKPKERLIPGDLKSPTNEEFFMNMKAQGWWALRVRFEKTFKAVTQGAKYDFEELISIDSTIENLAQLEVEFSQATMKSNTKGKMIVEKTPQGSKSPNLADGAVMCYFPCKVVSIFDVLR